MWLVHLSLRRPFVVWVGMVLVLVLGLVGYQRTPTDVLPNLKVPVVVVFASYRGMPAPDMEMSVVAPLERALTRCDHLEHIESRSLLGIGIVKLYFRPEVDPDAAAAQVNALVFGELQFLPPGMQPPSVFKYDAAAIPVGSLVLSSESKDDKFLLDLADHELRDELAGVEGLAAAPVFGGLFRQIQIYVRPHTLEAYRVSPFDLAGMVNKQSLVFPGAEMRIGEQNYLIRSNSLAQTPEEFKSMPLWSEGRKTVYLRDVASVEDGTRWRTNTVRVDGRPAVFMPLLRQGGASATRVIDRVQKALPELPSKLGDKMDDVDVEVAFDQSQYVRDALSNLRFEALGGAVLASLVVLLFLGSLRTTWIVALSIPLSILAAFIGLYFTGNTLNIMTLGGLALVLGRVVDDSIVDVENTIRHLNMGKTPRQAALDSAAEVSLPVLMATVTTTIVFFPITLMSGVGKYLFTPLAVSATLAMVASYIVSRTVSPLCCSRFLRPHTEHERFPRRLFWAGLACAILGSALLAVGAVVPLPLGKATTWFYRVVVAATVASAAIVAVALLFWCAPWFDRLFARFTAVYERALDFCLRRRLAVVGLLLAALLPAGWAFTHVGHELFPEVDSGDFTLHVRVPGGPRVEETERQVARIEKIIRGDTANDIPGVIPPEDLEMVLSNIGLSSRWSAIYTPNNGPHAAAIRVQLRSGFAGRHTPALVYVKRLRERLAEEFPGYTFFFETGGMVRSILNSGAVAPIEVQIHGQDQEERRDLAHKLTGRLSRLPQVSDAYMPQGMDLPQVVVNVDRSQAAQQYGFTDLDVMRSVVTSLMSSAQIAPNLWIDRQSGNHYLIGVQYPEQSVLDLSTLENIPITSERNKPGKGNVRKLKEMARIERTQGSLEIYRHTGGPVSQIFLNVAGNDLAGVATDVQHLTADLLVEFALQHLPDERRALADDATFKQKLLEYFQGSRIKLREALIRNYRVDPERLKRGLRVTVQGEVAAMTSSFRDMASSLALAILFVYLILAALFGSWLDPLIMVVAAPLGLIGVAVALWGTGTSLNVQSCMGILMMVGISVSNSILLVEFANREWESGLESVAAALSAARVRLRPIIMTTLATIAGLMPMALHLRPGDEMNLPLARAVIGGLVSSTFLTLFVVPVLYVFLKRSKASVEAPETAPGLLPSTES